MNLLKQLIDQASVTKNLEKQYIFYKTNIKQAYATQATHSRLDFLELHVTAHNLYPWIQQTMHMWPQNYIFYKTNISHVDMIKYPTEKKTRLTWQSLTEKKQGLNEELSMSVSHHMLLELINKFSIKIC